LEENAVNWKKSDTWNIIQSNFIQLNTSFCKRKNSTIAYVATYHFRKHRIILKFVLIIYWNKHYHNKLNLCKHFCCEPVPNRCHFLKQKGANCCFIMDASQICRSQQELASWGWPKGRAAASMQKSSAILLMYSSEFHGVSVEGYRWTLLLDFAGKNWKYFTEMQKIALCTWSLYIHCCSIRVRSSPVMKPLEI
jgi:hypothetical protein